MIEVSVEPDRVILLEHSYELRSDSLRKNYRSSGSDSYDLNVIDLSEFGNDVFKSLILNEESVSA